MATVKEIREAVDHDMRRLALLDALEQKAKANPRPDMLAECDVRTAVRYTSRATGESVLVDSTHASVRMDGGLLSARETVTALRASGFEDARIVTVLTTRWRKDKTKKAP